MPNHGAARQGLAGAIAAELRNLRDNAPWIRRREEYARLAFTELDIRRLAARPPEPEPEPERQLRLVHGP
jgi:hypothetical protein